MYEYCGVDMNCLLKDIDEIQLIYGDDEIIHTYEYAEMTEYHTILTLIW